MTMVLSKQLRVYHKLDNNSVYSVLLDNKNYKHESLLLEADAIATLGPSEADSVRHLYSTVLDAYGCLGVLQLSVGECVLEWMAMDVCSDGQWVVRGAEALPILRSQLLSLSDICCQKWCKACITCVDESDLPIHSPSTGPLLPPHSQPSQCSHSSPLF
ncbi:unnamed protein product, partial [Medioppia subpectinata]